MEARQLLAATITHNLSTREVIITGTAADDAAEVSFVMAASTLIRVVSGAESVERTIATSLINKVTFNAGLGADSLNNVTDRPVLMNGGDGADTLTGGTGNDTFDGGTGNDSVVAGLGDDSLIGSADNDYFDGGDGNDLLTVTADANFVIVDGSLTGQGVDTFVNVERVSVTGGISANSITAATATIPLTLNGAAGNDTIQGGLGNDVIDGGDGADTLNGFGANDTVVGGLGNDWVQGGSGVDFCDGGAGDDKVEGLGASGDTIRGGLGNDTLDGGAGTGDVISETGDANFRLTRDAVTGVGQLTGLGTDTLLNIEGAILAGGALANNINVSGFGLATTLTGGGGNDTLRGGTAIDVLVESGNVNFVLTNAQLTGNGSDSLFDFDQAILTGGDGANSINASGFTTPVTLFGGNGNDTLIGGTAADRLEGGMGNDRLTGNRGADTLLGQDGSDRLIESGDTNFALSNASLVGFEIDALFTLEEAELTGGASANSLTVSTFGGPVTLRGGAGNDSLEGTPFNDLLDGGDGDDFLRGEAGNDSLTGGNNNDFLTGDDGNDSLTGGAGNDQLFGANGDDKAFGEAGTDSLQGQQGNDSLDGGADADIVLGQQGNDTVLGGLGRDFLIGSVGTDSVNGGDGEDLVLGSVYKFENDMAALVRVLADWNAATTYATRIAALQNVTHPYFLKSLAQPTDNATLYDDYQKDTVLGGLLQDFILRPGDASLASNDATTDKAANETMSFTTYGTEAAGYFPTNMTKPGYLATLNDATFGTPITRVTGDPGSPLTLPLNIGGTTTIYWSGFVRTRYVTDSSWNSDGSRLMLRSYDPAQPYHIVLNGSTYQPQFVASLPTSNYRWSQNPATPNVQYGFVQQSVVDGSSDEGIIAPLPAVGPDDDKIVRYDVTTGQVLNTITLPFNKLFSAKSSIAFANGHEYAAMFGVDKTAPSATAISLYVVQLDAAEGANPVVASMLLTTADSGTPEPAYATSLDFGNLFFAPDGRHVLTLYNGSTTALRSWRLLDVDYAAGSITTHEIPDLAGDAAYQTNGDRTKGHFPINWSHPTFAFGPNGTDVYVVGVSGQYNGRTLPQDQIATRTGVVGSVLAFNATQNTFQSLSDPANENLATHVTATNTQHPGYVFVSYWNDNTRGSMFKGELVAINLADPFGATGTIRLAHHRTNIANRFYHGNTLPTVSPDGTRLIFSSTWGTKQSVVQSYVLNLIGKVP